MSDTAFAEAARPRPRVILRLPLMPYSLGHEIILQSQENLILAPEGYFNKYAPEIQCSALIKAVLVCSRTWQQNSKPDKWLNLWGWTIRNQNFPLAIADFRNYRTEGSSFPKIKPAEDANEGRTLGASFLSRLTDYASSRFGSDCFDQPLGMLQWMYFAEAEQNGSCRIENERERQIREEIEAAQAEYARKHKKEDGCQP